MRLLTMLTVLSGLLSAQVQNADGNVSCANPRACWEVLQKGNDHWAQEPIRLTRPNQTAERRGYVAGTKQKPFAAIVTCSDSRVPPELIFDRGLGDLFVIRVAGNIVDEFSLGTLQYGLQELGIKLVLVMGHEKCGAVEAALNFDPKQPLPAKPLRSLVEALVPARDWARQRWGSPVSLDDAVDANVYLNVERIKRLAEPIAGPNAVIGKRYKLDGHVVDLRPIDKK